jgi:hypothetical protein
VTALSLAGTAAIASRDPVGAVVAGVTAYGVRR